MIILRPLCPMCQTRTVLARVTPGSVGFDIRTFKCPRVNPSIRLGSNYQWTR